MQHRRRERDHKVDLQEVGVQEEEHLVHCHGECDGRQIRNDCF